MSIHEYNLWHDELLSIGQIDSHIVASNSVYHQHHTYQYTGILPVLLPSVPTYVRADESAARYSMALLFSKHIEKVMRIDDR